MRVFAVLSCLVISLAAASTTQAGLVKKFRKHDSMSVTKKKIQANLRHVAYICNNGEGRIKTTHCRATRWLRTWLHKISTPVLSIPHKSGWLCIHKYEGSWTDSGDPYWGGLQMDRSFMRTYAPAWLLKKGWADKWTPLEQMYVAERAYGSGRGYGPWPKTARFCGLL